MRVGTVRLHRIAGSFGGGPVNVNDNKRNRIHELKPDYEESERQVVRILI